MPSPGSLLSLAVVLLHAVLFAAAAVPVVDQVTFGHSIKNAVLPPKTELTTFQHNCSMPPCVVTLIHIPSIYPNGGDLWDWQHGILNIYVDDETVPSISLTLLQLASVGEQGAVNEQVHDGSPFGIDLMGKTANHGGVYSTVRIPFLKNLRTTVQSAYVHSGVLWFIIRGLEAQPVILGDLQLPTTARLRVEHRNKVFLNNNDFITLVNVSSDRNGALLRLQFDATGDNFGYLEACLRLYNDGATTPLYLSSGAEDYFMSSSYFDEGMFKTPNSGLTYYDSHGNLSAYKTHTHDPVLFRKGMALVWRNCEVTTGCGSPTQCPDRFCLPGEVSEVNATQEAFVKEVLRRHGRTPSNTNAVYTTVVWYYDWPSNAGASSSQGTSGGAADPLAICMPLLQRLEQNGALTKSEADAIVDALLDGHEKLMRVCSGAQHMQAQQAEADSFLARQLARLVRM